MTVRMVARSGLILKIAPGDVIYTSSNGTLRGGTWVYDNPDLASGQGMWDGPIFIDGFGTVLSMIMPSSRNDWVCYVMLTGDVKYAETKFPLGLTHGTHVGWVYADRLIPP